MTMHSHDRYRLLAATALDRPLEPEDRSELEEHLAGCAACRTDVARMRTEHDWLGDVREVAPDPRVHAAIMAAARTRRGRVTWSMLAVAAILLLGGIGGAVLAAGALDRTPQPGPSPSPAALVESPSGSPGPSPSGTPSPTARPEPSSATPVPSASPAGLGRWVGSTVALGAPARWVAAGDVDGDGTQDLVASLEGNDRLAVLLGRGDGRFRPPFLVEDTGIAVFDLVDATGDGVPDVVGAWPGGASVAILRGDGTGGFALADRRTVDNSATRPVVADLDGDGDLDIAVVEEETGVVSVVEGNGSGRLAAARRLATVDGATGLAGGDLDGDGRSDLVATGETTSLVTILLARGPGTDPAVRSLPVAADPYVPAVGDVDGDGISDIVVVHQATGLVSLLRGAGAGTFEPAVIVEGSHPGRDAPDSPVLGDLDGDGDLDLVLAATGHDHLDALAAGPSGVFDPPIAGATGSAPRNVALADLDGDGRVDLVAANGLAPTLSVLMAR